VHRCSRSALAVKARQEGGERVTTLKVERGEEKVAVVDLLVLYG
jgi:hypothetical protein